MWGWFIAIFVGMWLIQFILTRVQMRNYQTTLQKMSKRPSGFLGVGLQKQKLGIGVIVILVTDVKGEIVDCEVMQGVTVFTRFKPFSKYNGLQIEECKRNLGEESIDLATKMAIEKIETQMKKKKED